MAGWRAGGRVGGWAVGVGSAGVPCQPAPKPSVAAHREEEEEGEEEEGEEAGEERGGRHVPGHKKPRGTTPLTRTLHTGRARVSCGERLAVDTSWERHKT